MIAGFEPHGVKRLPVQNLSVHFHSDHVGHFYIKFGQQFGDVKVVGHFDLVSVDNKFQRNLLDSEWFLVQCEIDHFDRLKRIDAGKDKSNIC